MTDQEKSSMIAYASNCASFLSKLSKDVACGASPEILELDLVNASDQWDILCSIFGGIEAARHRVADRNLHPLEERGDPYE